MSFCFVPHQVYELNGLSLSLVCNHSLPDEPTNKFDLRVTL
jgi:hypothetical protein